MNVSMDASIVTIWFTKEEDFRGVMKHYDASKHGEMMVDRHFEINLISSIESHFFPTNAKRNPTTIRATIAFKTVKEVESGFI